MPTIRRRNSPQAEQTAPEEHEEVRRAVPRRRQAQQAQPQPHHRRPPIQRVKRSDSDSADKPTPILLKILSWLGIILLCFVLGYMGTSWFMEFLNKKLLLKPENRIESQEDLNELQEGEQERRDSEALSRGSDVEQVSLNLYHVQDDAIGETRKNFISRTREENIREAVEEILALSEVPNAEKIKLLHVFRNDETAFLDMPGQFASALTSLGKRKSLLLLTGLVKTLQENFSPITQIRFLIDSKPPKSGGEVNLAAPWKMPKKS